MDMPLLEFDPRSAAIVELARVVPDVDLPERVVACFFGDVVAEVVATRPDARRLTDLHSEIGSTPVWEIEVCGARVAVFQPGVGAPMTTAFTEEVIAMGGRRLVACGGAGALVPELALGHAVLVDSAVRDEGTSHHYAEPSRVIEADPDALATAVETVEAAGVAHTVGRSWTTDAIYRETRERVNRRVAERCVVVEMEAAALLAVTRFRGVRFAQVLLAGDSLAGEHWDDRGWMSARQARERVFWLAAEAAARL